MEQDTSNGTFESLMVSTVVPFWEALLPSPLPASYPQLDTDTLARLCSLVLRWNDRVDLVAPCEPAEFVVRHICDSLGLCACLGRAPLPALVDVGSGGGFPGLVVASVFPKSPVYLVEPREKRANFLLEARRELGLANVKVVRERIEDVQEIPLPHGSVVTTRATGIEAEIVSAAGSQPGAGLLAFMVGPSWDSAEACPGMVFQKWGYSLPGTAARHSIALANVPRGTPEAVEDFVAALLSAFLFPFPPTSQ